MKCLFEHVEIKSTKLRAYILGWAKENTRSFPWRNIECGSYEIMVAELLLKRTTATAAARTYKPFLTKYPHVEALAQATEEELCQDFKSVGLYAQRARTVAKLAQHLMGIEGGILPNTLEKLAVVPSIGDYSARAILSFGHGIPVAVVDANVKRILQRVFEQRIPAKANLMLFQEIADSLVHQKEHRQFNFAMLDLGALICRPSRPLCNRCPLAKICDYASNERICSPNRSLTSTMLRRARKEKGMSLKALSQEARTSKLTIINAEAGRTKPKLETLKKLSNALGIPVSNLLDDDF